jgi:hypothetical protein
VTADCNPGVGMLQWPSFRLVYCQVADVSALYSDVLGVQFPARRHVID